MTDGPVQSVAKTAIADSEAAAERPSRAFRYHPRHEPVPAGWAIVDDFSGCHHARHAVLIAKDD